MKRYGKLYEKIYDMENLKEAHRNARKDKLYYQEVKMVDSNTEYYLKQIQDMLVNETYEVSEYAVSIINDKGKARELMKLPYYPDRIIQWAIMLQIEDIFMKTFCTHTCASIKFRGIKRASELTSKYIKNKNETIYCLKFDVNKFYPSIDHAILKMMLSRKFKDKKLLNLLYLIIDSIDGDKGIPIGSYLSQFLANFYLSCFDHWLKEKMKVKYVVRYMDDVVILHNSKEYLHWLRLQIEIYLRCNLKLRLKDNWQVFPTNTRGVDFVGFRHFFNFKLLRKSTCKKFKKRMLKILKKQIKEQLINYGEWCSANSYDGWLKWCNGYRLKKKYLIPIIPSLNRYYNNVILKERLVA